MSKLIIKRWKDENPDTNILWLHAMQNLANDSLKANGRLTVYDLADLLDMSSKIDREKYEHIGWIYPTNDYDGFVDFGLDYISLLENDDDIELNLNDHPI